jgi:hypothetical protein
MMPSSPVGNDLDSLTAEEPTGCIESSRVELAQYEDFFARRSGK